MKMPLKVQWNDPLGKTAYLTSSKDMKNTSLTHHLFASFTCCVQPSQTNRSQLEFGCLCKAGADN